MRVIKKSMTIFIFLLMMLGYSFQSLILSISLLGVIKIIHFGRKQIS
jgi:hypothetical protein